MDIVEYLLFVPLLIYGIALSDLFGQWKRFMEPASWYIPYLISLVFVTEIGVYNVFVFFKLAAKLGSITYFVYWLYLIPPLLFLLMVNFLTYTDEQVGLETFFSSRRRPVFILLAAFIGIHFIPQFDFDQRGRPVQLLAIGLCILYAFWPKKVAFYSLVTIWFLSIAVRAYFIYAQS